jgi:hypothetical protein
MTNVGPPGGRDKSVVSDISHFLLSFHWSLVLGHWSFFTRLALKPQVTTGARAISVCPACAQKKPPGRGVQEAPRSRRFPPCPSAKRQVRRKRDDQELQAANEFVLRHRPHLHVCSTQLYPKTVGKQIRPRECKSRKDRQLGRGLRPTFDGAGRAAQNLLRGLHPRWQVRAVCHGRSCPAVNSAARPTHDGGRPAVAHAAPARGGAGYAPRRGGVWLLQFGSYTVDKRARAGIIR